MASQIRGKNGNFVPKTKFNLVRHHMRTKRLLLPIMALVAIVGAITVYATYASVWTDCKLNGSTYIYDSNCVTNSREASVARMYYATLNRTADRGGLNYWVSNIQSGKTNITKMADQFMGSAEFKNKYGALSNAAFVKAMYPQVFGRAADTAGEAYWTKKLDSKSLTRAQMMANFVQSQEMKASFSTRVALTLGISLSNFTSNTTTVPFDRITCLGNVSTDGVGKKLCTVSLASTAKKIIGAASVSLAGNQTTTKPGGYVVCADTTITNVASYSPKQEDPFTMYGGYVPVAGSVLNGSATLHQQPNTGSYTGFAPVNKQAVCSWLSILPSAEQTLLLPVTTQGQSAKATYSIDMNSIRISSIADAYSHRFVEEFDPSRTTQFVDSGDGYFNSTTVVIKGKTTVLPIRYNLGQFATSTSPKPDWAHSTEYFQGKQTVGINTSFSQGYSQGTDQSPTTIQLKVTNAVTGATIPNYQVVTGDSDTAGKVVYTPVDKSQFSLPGSAYGFYVKLDAVQPIKAKVEVRVLSGNPRYISNSFLMSGWPQ